MSCTTRRDFLATTSLAAAGLALGARPLRASVLNFATLRPSDTANTLAGETITRDELRRLALHAVDAAKSAGAVFADVRVSEYSMLNIEAGLAGAPELTIRTQYMFGVRASTGGPLAFVHGSVLTQDAIAAAAKQAVTQARGFAGMASARSLNLAPTPVVTGEWTTPIKVDPFTVPLLAQVDLIHALAAVVPQMLGAVNPGAAFEWYRDTRAFASTEGSAVTQTNFRARPRITAAIMATLFDGYEVRPRHFSPAAAGYESVQVPDLPDQIKAAAEFASYMSSLPLKEFDVGRVPAVFDGFSAGSMFAQTVGRALEADRALGQEADAAGLSYLSPPLEVLGNVVLNPLLNVTGNRAVPSPLAVKWDDEGVEPQEFTMLKDGRVVDFATSRKTAAALGSWYQSQGKPARSYGCTSAEYAQDPLQVRSPHTYIAPGTAALPLEDMYKDIAHGILVTRCDWVSIDPQLTTGMLNYGNMCEIKRGKIVSRVRDGAFIFSTKTLWKNLVAIGDQSTVRNVTDGYWKGNPWRSGFQSTTAPAMRFSAVDVISTARNLS